MPNGSAIMDVGGITETGRVPELIQLAELGSIWMILGICLKNEGLVQAGIKVAIWQTHTLDHQGLPHLSMWGHAASLNCSRLASYNSLLFSLAHRLTGEKGFNQASELQNSKIREPDSLSTHLLRLIPEKISPFIRLSYRPLAEEITLGFIKFTAPQLSITCSISGSNSGVFSFHKNDVSIINCAPQVAPCDALELFGIDRGCSINGRSFREVVWEKSSYHFRLKGWTKLFALPTWVEVDCSFQANEISLRFLFQRERPRENLRIAFYCSSKKVIVGGKTTLKAGLLEKYQGPIFPIELCGEKSMILITPKDTEEERMEIIPLAGGNHFFGADFLITVSATKTDFFSFVIK